MNTTTFRREDRVVIRAVEQTTDHSYINTEGAYLGRAGTNGTGAYLVKVRSKHPASTGTDNRIVRAIRIEHALAPWERDLQESLKPRSGRMLVTHPPLTQPGRIEVGDRVRVLKLLPGTATRSEARAALGSVGILEEKLLGDVLKPMRFRVNVGGASYEATEVERVGPPAPADKPGDAPVLIDVTRSQAAHVAHLITGPDALLDDVLGIAAFILGEHKATPSIPTTSTTSTPSSGPPLEDARKATAAALTVQDVTFALDRSPDDDVVSVGIRDDKGYLDASDIDRVIAYLQAAKVVHAARG